MKRNGEKITRNRPKKISHFSDYEIPMRALNVSVEETKSSKGYFNFLDHSIPEIPSHYFQNIKKKSYASHFQENENCIKNKKSIFIVNTNCQPPESFSNRTRKIVQLKLNDSPSPPSSYHLAEKESKETQTDDYNKEIQNKNDSKTFNSILVESKQKSLDLNSKEHERNLFSSSVSRGQRKEKKSRATTHENETNKNFQENETKNKNKIKADEMNDKPWRKNMKFTQETIKASPSLMEDKENTSNSINKPWRNNMKRPSNLEQECQYLPNANRSAFSDKTSRSSEKNKDIIQKFIFEKRQKHKRALEEKKKQEIIRKEEIEKRLLALEIHRRREEDKKKIEKNSEIHISEFDLRQKLKELSTEGKMIHSKNETTNTQEMTYYQIPKFFSEEKRIDDENFEKISHNKSTQISVFKAERESEKKEFKDKEMKSISKSSYKEKRLQDVEEDTSLESISNVILHKSSTISALEPQRNYLDKSSISKSLVKELPKNSSSINAVIDKNSTISALDPERNYLDKSSISKSLVKELPKNASSNNFTLFDSNDISVVEPERNLLNKSSISKLLVKEFPKNSSPINFSQNEGSFGSVFEPESNYIDKSQCYKTRQKKLVKNYKTPGNKRIEFFSFESIDEHDSHNQINSLSLKREMNQRVSQNHVKGSDFEWNSNFRSDISLESKEVRSFQKDKEKNESENYKLKQMVNEVFRKHQRDLESLRQLNISVPVFQHQNDPYNFMASYRRKTWNSSWKKSNDSEIDDEISSPSLENRVLSVEEPLKDSYVRQRNEKESIFQKSDSTIVPKTLQLRFQAELNQLQTFHTVEQHLNDINFYSEKNRIREKMEIKERKREESRKKFEARCKKEIKDLITSQKTTHENKKKDKVESDKNFNFISKAGESSLSELLRLILQTGSNRTSFVHTISEALAHTNDEITEVSSVSETNLSKQIYDELNSSIFEEEEEIEEEKEEEDWKFYNNDSLQTTENFEKQNYQSTEQVGTNEGKDDLHQPTPSIHEESQSSFEGKSLESSSNIELKISSLQRDLKSQISIAAKLKRQQKNGRIPETKYGADKYFQRQIEVYDSLIFDRKAEIEERKERHNLAPSPIIKTLSPRNYKSSYFNSSLLSHSSSSSSSFSLAVIDNEELQNDDQVSLGSKIPLKTNEEATSSHKRKEETKEIHRKDSEILTNTNSKIMVFSQEKIERVTIKCLDALMSDALESFTSLRKSHTLSLGNIRQESEDLRLQELLIEKEITRIKASYPLKSPPPYVSPNYEISVSEIHSFISSVLTQKQEICNTEKEYEKEIYETPREIFEFMLRDLVTESLTSTTNYGFSPFKENIKERLLCYFPKESFGKETLNKLLMTELIEEERNWTNFDEEENKIKDSVGTCLFNALLLDTAKTLASLTLL